MGKIPCRGELAGKSFREVPWPLDSGGSERWLTVGFLIAGHVDDDLDLGLVGQPGGEDFSHGGRQRILIGVLRSEGGVPVGESAVSLIRTCGPSGWTGCRRNRTGRKKARRVGECLIVPLAVVKPVADMSYRKLVAGSQSSHLDPLTVDPDAVGRPEVPNHDLAVFLHHAAVVSRNPQRVEPGITRGMPAHDHHGAVQHDVRTIIESHEACGHGVRSRGRNRRHSIGLDALPAPGKLL